MKTVKETKKRVKKTVEVIEPEPVETKPVEVATGESEAKKELRAYIEELKRKDAHEYAANEVRLLKELNNLK